MQQLWPHIGRGAYTEWWQMQVPTCSKAMGSARSQSGSTTTSSLGSRVHSSQNTTHAVPIGTMKSVPTGAAGKMAAGCGMAERTCRTAPRRSSTKIAAWSSRTWKMPPPAPWKTRSSPTPTQTSMQSQHALGFNGRPPSLFPLRLRFPTSVSSGTCARTSSPSSMTKGPDTWLPLLNGKASVHTIFLRRKSYMESSSTHRWSSQQDALTSLAWRPCSLPSTIIFSYRTPLPATLRAIPFVTEVPYLGFQWNLHTHIVSLLDDKRTRYLAAIVEWEGKHTHNLLETQKLYGKLLHASLVIPAGRAYLTGLEAMLSSFNDNIFLPHTPPRDTQGDPLCDRGSLPRFPVEPAHAHRLPPR